MSSKIKRSKPSAKPPSVSVTPSASVNDTRAQKQPVGYSDKLAAEILQRLSQGQTLQEICRSEGMPTAGAVVHWCTRKPEFGALYASARSAGLEVLADEILAIADDATNDYMMRQSQSGMQKCLDAENVNRSRLRIDSRKWLLSKLKPEKYGEFERIEMSGKMTVVSSRETLAKELDERRRARLSAGTSPG